MIKQTIEKRREERREKLLKTTPLLGLSQAPTQFSRSFSRFCSAWLSWSREQASKKWEDRHPDSSPGLLVTKMPLTKVNSRCFKLQALISSPQFFNCWRIFLELNFQELRLSWKKKKKTESFCHVSTFSITRGINKFHVVGRPFPILLGQLLSNFWRLEQFFAVLATSSKFCLS